MTDQGSELLDPFSAVLSIIAQNSTADNLQQFVMQSGVDIDWTLNEKENFSNKTRIRNYLPRIKAKADTFSYDDRLKAAFIMCKNFINDEEKAKLIEDSLRDIGWELNDTGLSPLDETAAELFFEKGQVHDAYVSIRGIIEDCNRELFIVDGYLDSTLFQLLKSLPDNKDISSKLLTNQQRLPSDFEHEKRLYTKQYPRISINLHNTTRYHDRFLIVDDEVYHIGASIKDAGKKAFLISKIETAEIAIKLKELIKQETIAS